MRKWNLILPVSKFFNKKYGEWIEISKDFVEKMFMNFKNKMPDYGVSIDIEHMSEHGSYGKVTDLRISEKGLEALLDYTDVGKELVEAQKFKYLSPTYSEKYNDKRTGKEIGPVLLKLALTNTPALPDMEEIIFSDGSAENIRSVTVEIQNEEVKRKMEINEIINQQRIDLTESRGKVKELSEQIEKKEDKIKTLSEEISAMKKKTEETEADLKKAKQLNENFIKEKNVLETKAWENDWIQNKHRTPAIVKQFSEQLISQPDQKAFFDSVLEKMPEIDLSEFAKEDGTAPKKDITMADINAAAQKMVGGK
jgi:phage I-like protein